MLRIVKGLVDLTNIIDSGVVRSMLINRKMTIRDLAKTVDGLSESTLANIVRRDVRATFPVIGKLSEALNCEPAEFLKKQTSAQVFISDRRRELEALEELREEFAANYPADSERLATIDALIARNRNAIELETKGDK